MNKTDRLIYNGKPIKDFSKDEIIFMVEHLYNHYYILLDLFRSLERTSGMEKTKIVKPLIGLIPDTTGKRKVHDDRLNFDIFVPKEYDELETEHYILHIIDRAKKFKRIVEEKKLDIMPEPDEQDIHS